MATAITASPIGDGRGQGQNPWPRRRRGLVRAIPLLPAVILLGLFLLGPILESFYGSFTNSALTGAAAAKSSFIGLKNYSDLFASPGFTTSVVLTLIFIIGSAVIGQNVVGMILALLLRHGNRVIGAF